MPIAATTIRDGVRSARYRWVDPIMNSTGATAPATAGRAKASSGRRKEVMEWRSDGVMECAPAGRVALGFLTPSLQHSVTPPLRTTRHTTHAPIAPAATAKLTRQPTAAAQH